MGYYWYSSLTVALAYMIGILRIKNFQALLVLVSALVVYRLKIFEVLFGLSTASVQYALIIPLLISVALFSINDFKVPKLALVLAFCISCLMALVHLNMSRYSDKGLNVLLSPFISDDAQIKSIKFQNLLKATLAKYEQNINYLNLANPVESNEDAEQILKDVTENSVLIAGTDRWLKLYFTNTFLASSSDEQIQKELNIKLVRQVKSIGLSDAGSNPTQNYVSLLIRAYNQLNLNNLEAAESLLIDAGSIYGKWTTPAHRAYPYWLSGTLQLQNLSLDDLSKNKLNCVLQHYNKAISYIHNRNSPELLAAILNNRGVANLLAYTYFGKIEFKKRALKDIRKATKLIPVKSNPHAWVIAKENNWILNRIDKTKKKNKKVKNKKSKPKK